VLPGSAQTGYQLKLEGVYHNCLTSKLNVTWDPEIFAGLTVKVCRHFIISDMRITPLAFFTDDRKQMQVQGCSITILVFER
jgi:hypothetical protein